MAEVTLFSSDEVVQTTVQAVLGSQHRIETHALGEERAEADLVIADLGENELAQPETLDVLVTASRLLLLVDRSTPLPSAIKEGGTLAVLRMPFEPFELRVKVDRLLALPVRGRSAGRLISTRDESDMWLEFPYVPAPAGALLRRAAELDAPLWIMGEPGCARRRVAAVVARRHDAAAHFVTWYADETLEELLARNQAAEPYTLYVPDIEERSLFEQERLLALAYTRQRFRLIASSLLDPAEQASDGAFSRGLYHALIGLAVQLSPLRERPESIAPLVRMFTFPAARRLGYHDVTYSEAAMTRLQNYMWPGNLIELEAVIHRTLVYLERLGSESVIIEVDELRLAPDAAGPGTASAQASLMVVPALVVTPEGVRVDPRLGRAADDAGGGLNLEHLFASLAHDFRNPLVPIKTLASMLKQGETDAARASSLIDSAGRACDRIAGDIDTLNGFAELGAPCPAPVDVGAVLARCLQERGSAVQKTVRVDLPDALEVICDPAQLEFAVDALLDASLAEVGERGTVAVNASGTGTIQWRLEARPGPVTHLGRWSGRSGQRKPWRIMLAEALTVRNGGSLEMDAAGSATTLAWTLPVKEGGGSRGRQTNRTHR